MAGSFYLELSGPEGGAEGAPSGRGVQGGGAPMGADSGWRRRRTQSASGLDDTCRNVQVLAVVSNASQPLLGAQLEPQTERSPHLWGLSTPNRPGWCAENGYSHVFPDRSGLVIQHGRVTRV